MRRRHHLDDSAKARMLRAYNAGTPVASLEERFGVALYPVLAETKSQKRGRQFGRYHATSADL
jgi:hypothetical protein